MTAREGDLQPATPLQPEHPQGHVIRRALYLSQVDLAARWGVCVQTIRRWRATHRIPAHDRALPGHPKWRVSAIERFEVGSPERGIGRSHDLRIAP